MQTRFRSIFSLALAAAPAIGIAQVGVLMVKPVSWGAPETADGMEYNSYVDHTGYWTVTKPNGTAQNVEAGCIVGDIIYQGPNQFPEIRTRDDLGPLADQINLLKNAIAKFPNTRRLLSPRIAALNNELARYTAGQRKHNNNWYSQRDYAKVAQEEATLAARETQEAENQRLLNQQELDARQREIDNEREQERIAADQQRAAEEVAKEQARKDRIASFGDPPVANILNNTYSGIVDYLKPQLNDPDRLRIYSSSKPYLSDDGWLVLCDWGAPNLYGGMIRKHSWFVFQKGVVIDMKDEGTYNLDTKPQG